MSLNHTRLQALLKKELSLILQSEAKNSKIGFVTITDLHLTKDLSYATVYFSIIGPKERVSVSMEGLEKSKGFLKSELSKRIKNIGKTKSRFKVFITIMLILALLAVIAFLGLIIVKFII